MFNLRGCNIMKNNMTENTEAFILLIGIDIVMMMIVYVTDPLIVESLIYLTIIGSLLSIGLIISIYLNMKKIKQKKMDIIWDIACDVWKEQRRMNNNQ
tara:strand:+ start:318 stop:611 length:294 start_codon:yes stop_codon:yes gene_type:complete